MAKSKAIQQTEKELLGGSESVGILYFLTIQQTEKELLDYYEEPKAQMALDHLHGLRDYFFCIIDELETLSREVKTLNNFIYFQGALQIIEDYFVKMAIINLPPHFNKGTYFSIIGERFKILTNY